MPKSKKNPIQQALKDLLANPYVTRQIASERKTAGSPRVPKAVTTAVEKGDIPFLCKYLRQNPTSEIPQPICELMDRLRFLLRGIEDDEGDNIYNPDPTQEWLVDQYDEREWLPLGTRDAARQALVDLAQAWLEGMVKDYTIEPISPEPHGKKANKRGPKDKVDSLNVYGDVGVRPYIFHDMLEVLEAYKKPTKGASKAKFVEEDFKKGSEEKPAAFEERTVKLVQRVHQEFGYHSKYFKSEKFGAVPKILDLPPSKARIIAHQAIVESQKWINPRNLLCGLLAEYERNDPTELIAISQLIVRGV